MLYFSISPPCKAQKTSMKRNRCVILQHPDALQGPKNLYKEGNRCVIFQHSAALQGPKTSIKRGIAVLYFSSPPPCKAQKTSMKRNRCVILQHSAALQGPKTALSFTAEDFYGEYPHQPDVQARIFGCLQAGIIAKRTQRACLAEHIVL